MVLDTGASTTGISDELAVRLGLHTGNSRKGSLLLADGREIDTRLAEVDGIAVGSRKKSPIEIAIITPVGDRGVHDGILGQDFLGDNPYRLDLRNGLIQWQ